MRKPNTFDLNVNVDFSSNKTIHNGEEPKLTKKSSIQYENALRSYTKDERTDYPLPYSHSATVDGKTVTLDNGLAVSSSYAIERVKKVAYQIDLESIQSSGISSNGDVYYAGEDGLWMNSTKIASGQCAVSKDAEYYTIGSTLYHNGSSVATLSFSPNSIEHNSSFIVIGIDLDDQYQCRWAAYSTSYSLVYSGSYQGCVANINGTIVVTGQPYYKSLSPTRLTNGVLRWKFDSTDASSALSSNVSFANSLSDDMPTTPSGLKDATESYTYSGRGVSYGNASIRVAVYFDSSIHYVDDDVSDGVFLTTDPNLSPGVFWSTSVSEYNNIFPYMYLFTNVVTQRDKTYGYGKGWTNYYRVTGGYTSQVSASTNGHTVGLPAIYFTNSSRLRMWSISNGYRDLSLDVQAATYSTNEGVNVDQSDNIWFLSLGAATSTNGYRYYAASPDIKNDKAWPSFYHTVGGTNSGDSGLASTFPFSVSDGSIREYYYSNMLSHISYNGVLINTASSDGLRAYASNGEYILLDSAVYRVSSDVETKIYKVADNMYTTNLLTNDNLIVIDSDKIAVQKAYLPYNMEATFSTPFLSLSMWQPSSSTNDIWFQGMAYNVNLKDTVNATTFIYPDIQVPLYIPSDSLEDFNKTVIDNNAPLLVPYNSGDVDVYYTHTLLSTDNIYRYTLKSGVSSYDSSKADNSWTSTSTLIVYPVGIGSVIADESGRNTAAPSVDLLNLYAARLYSSNNSYFLSINSLATVYKGSEIFTIYTSSYYFDGQAIYFVGGINDTTSNSFVCYALGMTYIGASGTEAYFWSDADKSIYVFSGSTTLTKWQEMAGLEEIYDTCFYPAEQKLYILGRLNGEDKLIVLSNETSAVFDGSNGTFNMIDIAVYVNDENGSYAYSPYRFERMPLDLETEWIGDPATLFKFGYMDFYLTKVNDKKATIELEADTLYDKNVEKTKTTVVVSPNDFTSDIYRLRVMPAANVGNAVRYSLHTDDDVSVQAMTFALDQASEQGAARR